MEQPNSIAGSLPFKYDEEVNKVTAKAPPRFMLSLKQDNPDRKILKEDQLKDAKKELLNEKFMKLSFPKERKFRVDPRVNGQSVGIISFIPSTNAKPDKDGCFGVLKIRGNFPTEVEAKKHSEMLLKKHDTFASYDLVHVGRDFPLMIDNSVFASETREISTKATIDSVTQEYTQRKKEEERIQREEVEERQRKLQRASVDEDEDEAETTLDFYTQLRVKKAYAQYTIDEANKKIVEAKEAAENASKKIEELDKKFPTYKTDYIMQYNNALESIGTNPKENHLIKYMKSDMQEQKSNDNDNNNDCDDEKYSSSSSLSSISNHPVTPHKNIEDVINNDEPLEKYKPTKANLDNYE